MLARIKELALQYEDDTINIRRDIHKYAETGWTEYRTASLVAKTLEGLRWQVFAGYEVIDEESMMGVRTLQNYEDMKKELLHRVRTRPGWKR